jgi:hypothetical protein
MRSIPIKLLFFVLSITLVTTGFPSLLRADDLGNDEVVFTGNITSVTEDGEGGGTLFIRLENFDLRVIVNSNTELLDNEGVDSSLGDLEQADLVEIRGKFSASGILASQVRLLESGSTDFEIRGHITAIPSVGEDGMEIALLGITILVDGDTTIEQDGTEVGPSALSIGTHIWAEGTTDGDTWTATLIRLLQGNRKEKVAFEGVIEEITSDGIIVDVDGTDGDTTPVVITPKTRIVGELTVGAHVLVKGIFNPDLSVTAKEIRVLQTLEIKPEQRKIAVGEEAAFMVKLRESASEDMEITLSSSDEGIATVSPTSLVISEGSKTASFTVTGVDLGNAQITAETETGETATAEVIVGQLSEADDVPREMSISFAPSHIKMLPNDTREVVLLIKPPRPGDAPPDVEFASENGLVGATVSRSLGNGAASIKVLIESGPDTGTDSVTASLPDFPEAGVAELLVEVAEKHNK